MDQYEYPLFIINAFTNAPFSGSPAAICLVKKSQIAPDDDTNTDVYSAREDGLNILGLQTTQDIEPSDQLKQKLAVEMNMPTTAFLTTISDKDEFSTASRFGLRWFSSTTELKICGHATLASSAVLFNCIGNTNQAITFETLTGELTVRKTEDGKFCMDFPCNKPEIQDEEEVKTLIKVAVGTLPYQDVQYSPATKYLFIRLEDNVTKSQFQSHTPPSNLLLHSHDGQKILGVCLTLKGSSENGCTSEDGTVYDFVSRFFGPWIGIAEDPVTGSAHTVLAPYWAGILGKKQLFASQCSKRSGQLWLDISNEGRVEITGEAVAFIKGSVHI